MSPRPAQDSLDAIPVFVRVAQCASFTEAARQLGLSASGVSRAIARLETRLGTRLVDRTTRRLALTAEGSAYFERCSRILADLEDAEAALAEAGRVPRGPLRIQVSRGFGRTVIIPAIAGFLARYPEVTVDITVDDGSTYPNEDGLDASFVLGEPVAGRFVTRRLCTIGYAICASPDYLRRHGVPKDHNDLAGHLCLNNFRPLAGRRRDWTLVVDGKEIAVPVTPVLNANDIQAVHQAAVSGAGLAYLTDFLIAEDVRADRLRIVLPEHVLRGVPVYVCYPQTRHRSPRITAFVDYLIQALGSEASWSIDRLVPPD